MKKSKLILLLSGILLVFFSGCMTSSDFNYVERAVKEQIYPAKIKTNFKFSFGPISLSTAKAIVSFTDKGKEATTYLKEIKKVQVGVYEITTNEQPFQLKIPKHVEKKLDELGWEVFIRVREKDEQQVDLFYKQIDKHIGSIYVIVIEEDELVIVEVRGRLERLIEKAIQEHGFPQKNMWNIS